MVVATSARLWPASERTASEPEASPAADFVAVINALTAIEASAALSFNRLAPFIDDSRSAGADTPLIGPSAQAHIKWRGTATRQCYIPWQTHIGVWLHRRHPVPAIAPDQAEEDHG